ncbi:MAG TPA: hypothetical protein VJZ25_05165 [Gemmatimonadaceae bacterium]|nr:hypothetical protein [Gemmatimonadaceae bacterium]
MGISISLIELRFGGFRVFPHQGEFTFRIQRAGSGVVGNGKGATDCKTGRLALITIDTW